MPYATVILRDRECEIAYRILSVGPGSGWETEWSFCSHIDTDEIGDTITPTEEEEINKAINLAEGLVY